MVVTATSSLVPAEDAWASGSSAKAGLCGWDSLTVPVYLGSIGVDVDTEGGAAKGSGGRGGLDRVAHRGDRRGAFRRLDEKLAAVPAAAGGSAAPGPSRVASGGSAGASLSRRSCAAASATPSESAAVCTRTRFANGGYPSASPAPQLAGEEAGERRVPRRGGSPRRRGPASAPAPGLRPRRGRCGRRAGRPARRSVPRPGSRGTAGLRRRRGRRRALPRGSRGPWRPSAVPAGRRTARRRSARGSPRGRPTRAAVSESRRNTGAGATSSEINSCARSVPAPWRAMLTEPHSGHASGIGSRCPQWWQRSAPECDDQRDVAVGAPGRPPAGPAVDERSPSPPVEHHDRLALSRRDLGQGLAGAWVQRPASSRAVAHVEHLDGGQAPAVGAIGELDPIEREPGLRPRGRGPGHQHCSALARHGAARRRERRSGGRSPACRRLRAPRRRSRGRGRRSARTPPSGGRPRPGPLRFAGASTRRGAAPRSGGSEAAPPARRAATGSGPSSAG